MYVRDSVAEGAMGLVAIKSSGSESWTAHANSSLSANGNLAFFLAAAAISGLIAGAFCFFGAWPVIPFTGLELMVLWWALQRNKKHAGDFERITLEPGRLCIETRDGALTRKHELNPYWARVHVPREDGGNIHRLLIRSHGKMIEVGNLLTKEEKVALETQLTHKLNSR